MNVSTHAWDFSKVSFFSVDSVDQNGHQDVWTEGR